MSKDFNEVCTVVKTIGPFIEQFAASRNISRDNVIEAVAAILGANLCEKHKIIVRSSLETSREIMAAAERIVMSNDAAKPNTKPSTN